MSAIYKVSHSAQIVKNYAADGEGVDGSARIIEEDCDNWVSQSLLVCICRKNIL